MDKTHYFQALILYNRQFNRPISTRLPPLYTPLVINKNNLKNNLKNNYIYNNNVFFCKSSLFSQYYKTI